MDRSARCDPAMGLGNTRQRTSLVTIFSTTRSTSTGICVRAFTYPSCMYLWVDTLCA